MRPRQTPPVATAILWILLPRRDREFVMGDLEERFMDRYPGSPFRARLWYWSQVVRCAPMALTALPSACREMAKSTVGAKTGSLWLDTRHAFRTLLRGRGFTAGVVLILALGVGSTTVLFSGADSTLFRPLPFRDPEKLVRVSLLIPPEAMPVPTPEPVEMVWSYPKYRVLQEHQEIFQNLATYHRDEFTLAGVDRAERIWGEIVGGSYFSVLGLEPVLGRTFLPEEDETQGTHYVVVLSHGLWVRSFGSDPGVLGRTIHLNGTPHTVVGVGPRGFNGLWGTAELWVPTMTESERALASLGHSYAVIARLLPGITPERLTAAMARLGARVDEAYPSSGPGGPWSATARPLDEYRASSTTRRSLLILLAATALLLMVACVNIAGLLLSRGLSRGKEIATRMALGASRLRLMRHFLIEGLILSVLGGTVGLALAAVGVEAFNALGAAARFEMAGLERLSFSSIRIDARVLVFSVTVMALAPLLFSLLPAVISSRVTLAGSLKGGGSSQGSRVSRTRRAMLVTQVALAFVLMVSSSLMLTTVRRLHAVNMGFDPEGMLSLRVALPESQYDRPASQATIDRLVAEVGALPGVESVTFSNCAPLADGCRNTISASALGLEESVENELFGVSFVLPGYFGSTGVPVLAGRAFSTQDLQEAPRVAVVSEAAASWLWPGENPLGRRISLRGGQSAQVVGVVSDVRYSALEDAPLPEVYLPTTQWARREGFFLIRTATDPLSLVAAVRATVREIDPDLPLFDVREMSGRVADATWKTRFNTLVFSLFALMALTLAAVGLFAAQSYAVRGQARAIGIKMALGADQRAVLSRVLWGGVSPTLAGIGIGIVASLATSGILGALLFETDPREPKAFVIVSILFLTLATLASYLPGRRAASVDPVEVLRAE